MGCCQNVARRDRAASRGAALFPEEGNQSSVHSDEEPLTGRPAWSPPTASQHCVARCCCLKVWPRSTVGDALLAAVPLVEEPSLFQQLCLCNLRPAQRAQSGLEAIPEVAALAGVMLQHGEHSGAGTLLTMKWGTYDHLRRRLQFKVHGGMGQAGLPGNFAQPVGALSACLMNLGRLANYTYSLDFSADFMHAHMDALLNPIICVPCLPAWCFVPRCVWACEMVQYQRKDGTQWVRHNNVCGLRCEGLHAFQQVITPSGNKGAFYANLELFVPQQVAIPV